MQKNISFIEIIGLRLKQARFQVGVEKIEDLAEHLNSSYTAISRIEGGRSSYKLLNNYLYFLRSKGINLNDIYESIEEK